MQYFKNIELAKIYQVSKTTVAKWIEASQQGKLDLTLCIGKDRQYIAKSIENVAIIERIVEERRKYRNTQTTKTVRPHPDFYKIFSQEQIYDIVKSIELHREIPVQYGYFRTGAKDWDEYATRVAKERTPHLLTRTIELLKKNESYIDEDITSNYKHINIIDLGVGNALPVKKFLNHLIETNKLGRYTALDISPEMLSIAERNIGQWFEGKVKFERYEHDMNYRRFASILAPDHLIDTKQDTANLVLLLGGTLGNLRYPDEALAAIRDSIGGNDFLFYIDKLEDDIRRVPQWVDFANNPIKSAYLKLHGFILSMLNIDESIYDVGIIYDNLHGQRRAVAKLKTALTIIFNFEGAERRIYLSKGETILLWRSVRMTMSGIAERFDRLDLDILHSSKTRDREYGFIIAQVKHQ